MIFVVNCLGGRSVVGISDVECIIVYVFKNIFFQVWVVVGVFIKFVVEMYDFFVMKIVCLVIFFVVVLVFLLFIFCKKKKQDDMDSFQCGFLFENVVGNYIMFGYVVM